MTRKKLKLKIFCSSRQLQIILLTYETSIRPLDKGCAIACACTNTDTEVFRSVDKFQFR